MRYFNLLIVLSLLVFSCKEDCNCPEDDTNNDVEKKEFSFDNDLIAYWDFDDGTSKDVSGNENHGEFRNDFDLTEGIWNGAVELFGAPAQNHVEGNGGYIKLPSISFKQLDEFTIALWVNEKSVAWYQGDSYFFIGNTTREGWLGISHSGADVDSTMYVKYSVGSIEGGIDPIKVPFDYSHRGKWIFYAMTYKDGKISAYRNDILEGELEQEVKYLDTDILIGSTFYTYNGDWYCTRLNAIFDEIRVYSIALNQEQISKLYNMTP
jgi:hypothetical protein